MTLQIWRKGTAILAILGALLFLIFIGIAILLYAGGNSVSPSAPGYSFLLNSWSDLGRTIAWSGKNNFGAQVFFSLAMILWAISFVPSVYTLSTFFLESKTEKIFGTVGTICAFICSFTLFITVVFFPLDIHPLPHNIFAAIGYLSLLIVEILFTYLMFANAKHPKKHALCFLIVVIAILLYIIFGAALFQKLVSFSLLFATIIVFYDILIR
jgi:hypothetical protein